MGEGLIAGRNPVREALLAGRPVERLLVAEGAGGASLAEIVRLAAERGIAVQYADRRRLDRLAEGQVHQGVVAIAAPKAYVPLEEIRSEEHTSEHKARENLVFRL